MAIITHTVDLLIDAITMEKDRNRDEGSSRNVTSNNVTSASIRQLDGVLVLTHSLTYLLTYSLTHSLTHSLTR